jgi:hypothetical protein
MRTRVAAIVFIIVNCLTAAPAPAQGDLFRVLLGAVRQAANRTQELFDDINYVEKTLNEVRDNKRPETRESSRWKDLVKNYNELDASISALSVQVSFNDAQFAISKERILPCDTRAAEVAHARALADALSAALQDSADIVEQLDTIGKQASASSDALVEIQKLYERLIKTPVLGDQFQWDWFELQTKVSHALGNVKASVRTKRREIVQQRVILVQKRSNLLGNLDEITKIDCKLAPQLLAPPAPPKSAFTFMGCFKDSGSEVSVQGRDLNGAMFVDASMVPAKCRDTCLSRGFAYAGLQFGKHCFCGNSFGKFGAAGNCNMACSGAQSQVCGGVWANSVYQLRP